MNTAMGFATSALSISETVVEMLRRASLQMLLPLGLLLILELSRNSISASAKCWIYRAMFLKIVILFFFPFSVDLPLLPVANMNQGDSIPLREDSMFEVRSNGAGDLTTDIVSVSPVSNEVAPRSWKVMLPPILFVVWMAGVGLVIGRTWNEAQLCRTYARSGTRLIQSSEQHVLRELAERLSLKRLPELRVMPSDCGPVLVGVFRPVILVPQWLVSSEVEFRLAVAHELSHCRRLDLVWNVLVRVVNGLFFFHPLVWWSIRRYHVAVEIACDQSALKITGAPPRIYGELLLQSLQSGPFSVSGAGLSLALAPFTCLKERLMAIGSNSSNYKYSFAAALAALAAISVPPFSLAQQQQSSDSAKVSTDEAGSNFSVSDSVSVSSDAGGAANASAKGSAVGAITIKDGTQFYVRANATASNQHTSRSIAFHDGDTRVEITESPGKVRVRVTTTDDEGEKTSVYSAKNVEELKKNSPQGYKLYERHMLDNEPEPEAEGIHKKREQIEQLKQLERIKRLESKELQKLEQLKQLEHLKQQLGESAEEFHTEHDQQHEEMKRMEEEIHIFEAKIQEQRKMLEKTKQAFDERVRAHKEMQDRFLRDAKKRVR